MSWADGVARATIRNGRVYADGTVHTLEGWERRLMRDRARNRARVAVKQQHPAEYEQIASADPDRRESRRRARSYRVLADRYPDEYRAAYEKALADQGYDRESHPCSSVSPTATVAPENECCPAVGSDRAAFPNRLDERQYEMAQGTREARPSEAEAL